MGTDGTTPDGTAAAVAAVEAADAAAHSAAQAATSADAAMQAAAEAAVSAALAAHLAPINAALAELKAAADKLASDETTDDAEAVRTEAAVTKVTNVMMSLQSQWLWICAICLLFGAALGYVLIKAFE